MMSAAKGLIVAVISLIIGIIMLLFYVNYVDSSNTASLDANTLNIINSIPVFLGLSLLGVAVGSIWAGFKGVFGSGKDVI